MTKEYCCEEAQLTANELARRNEELSEAEAEIAGQARNIKWWVHQYERAQDHRRTAEAERDELQRKLDATEKARDAWRECAKDKAGQALIGAIAEELTPGRRDKDLVLAARELRAKLDAAEQRPTLDRDTVEAIVRREAGNALMTSEIENIVAYVTQLAPAVTSWLGDIPEKPKVERTGDGRWSVEGRTYQNGFLPVDMRRAGWDWFAIADHADAEKAATNKEEQIMATAKALYEVMSESSVPFEESNSTGKSKCISAARAGWTPPENKEEQ